jgi:homoserine kinase type II
VEVRLDDSDIAAVLAQYEIGALEKSKLIYSAWNVAYKISTSSGEYVLKILQYSDEAALRNDLRILSSLDKSIPHASPVLTASGGEYIQHRGRPTYIMPFIDGHPVDDGGTLSMPTLSQLASYLARIHASPISVQQRDTYQELKEFYSKLPPSKEAAVVNEAFSYLEGRGFYELDLPEGFTHMDLHTCNALFRDNEVVAILDFEDAHIGPFLYDIGLTALDTCCEGDVVSPSRLTAFIDGYQTIRALEEIEHRNLGDAMLHAGLYMFQWYIVTNGAPCEETFERQTARRFVRLLDTLGNLKNSSL